MGISKITRNFQITLPKDIREQKKFKVGDKVLFVVENDSVGLIKMNKDAIYDAAGLWGGLKETGLEYERKLRSKWKKRL